VVYKSVKSKKAAYLFVLAAVLEGIQAIVISSTHSISWWAPIFGLFAGLFLVAAAMARFGLGYAGATQRHVGGGWYRESVEKADACICGFTMGIAVFIVTVMNVPFPQGVPGALAGIFAFIAGIFTLRNSMKQGVYDSPGAPVPTPVPPPVDSVTCKYCGKIGISPQAASCPSCGQPMQ